MSRWSPFALRPDALAGDRLPYAGLVDQYVVRLRDGALMIALQIPGFSFETADAEVLNAQAAAREVLFRSTLDARFMLYHHVMRRRVALALPGEFADPVSAHVDARWQAHLASGTLFVNDQFVTLVRRPARGKAGWAERIARGMRRSDEGEAAVDPAELRALYAAATSMLATLAPYGAQLLGDHAGMHGVQSEPLELLSALYNGEMRPVRRPDADTDVGQMLPYHRVSFGHDALELAGPSGPSFGAMLSLKDYPDATSPGLTDALLRLPVELVLTESYAPADRQIARERIDLAIRRLRSADEEAHAERRDMAGARDALGVGAVGFGDHHLTVLVRSADLAALDAAAAAAAAALGDVGAVAVREDINLEAAFWAQFPGNEGFAVRRSLISSANMACFGAFNGFAMGRATGNHWGDAVTLLQTTSATPYFMNFHNGDLGNFTVIGPSGSGKTVVMNFLAAQAQKFGPRLVLFDKDRGAEAFIRSIGGHYSRLTPGHPTGFNPLRLPDDPVNRAFLRDWLAALLDAHDPEELALIAAAVDAAYANAPALRQLRHFRELLAGTRRPRHGDLASRLDGWIGAGEHAWLFDNADDALDLTARTLGFDMTALLETPALRTPAMMYLFHRVEERLDGTPTMLLIDEGWKALDDEVFAARIRDWLKTLRKRNALVGFATQSARDALDSRIAAALVEQTATMIFMPNPRARMEDYGDGFGLTAHEVALIRALPAHSRCFLIRQADDSVVVRLDLSGAPEVLTLLSGREATVRKLDRLRAERGDHPAFWFEALTGTAWPGEIPVAPAPVAAPPRLAPLAVVA